MADNRQIEKKVQGDNRKRPGQDAEHGRNRYARSENRTDGMHRDGKKNGPGARSRSFSGQGGEGHSDASSGRGVQNRRPGASFRSRENGSDAKHSQASAPVNHERGRFSDRRPAVPAREGYRAFEHRPQVNRPVEGLPSRRSALKVVRAVTEDGAWASTALDKELQNAGLNPKDRRLAARLAYDTLDRLYYLDAILNQVMAKPDTDIRLRNILRLGTCQLLLEDHIPDNAATDTAVELCREIGLDGLAGVCNGILRNLIRRREELTIEEENPVKRLSIVCSAPEFLVRQLAEDYGMDGAEQILKASGRDSELTIRPNLMRLKAEDFEKLLSKKVWECEKGELRDSWFVRGAANIAQDNDFLSGNFSIQSEQSQMACLAAAPKRGAMVLDTCAAPGGKSCYMAEMMDGTGRVQAWEIREHRTKLIEAQVKRLGLDNVRPMTRDASILREDLIQSMDVVLLDAPCTGTGEMHDKPDSKYRMKEESREELVALQKVMLDTVCRYVKAGGTLVYSTCSVLKDENERQILSFLERHPEFEVIQLPETIPERIRKEYGTGVQLLPGVNASGGFYICRMRRKRL
ncbi:MAG: 16S rRNA (cytosine(967)-C(5))-methyltransferase RsmB [Clostridiales bacterium]|nr:16S rRNA (cytosine(967)-C(5))-methyltransferase RsmB [Clostridiales bacterium]